MESYLNVNFHSQAEKMQYKRDYADELESALFSLNSPIEHLTLRNVRTHVIDDRPLIQVCADAAIQLMSIELQAIDSALQAVPLWLMKGSRVERLNFALDWKGAVTGHRKPPIRYDGGVVDQLRWVGAPPN
jgi:hypothetical protein